MSRTPLARFVAASALTATGFCPVLAPASPVSFTTGVTPGSTGNWIREDSTGSDTSGSTILFVGGLGNGSGSPSATRALLSYDLSTLPDFAEVTAVSLVLTVEANDASSVSNPGETMSLQELTTTPTTSSNWATSDGSTAWTTPGGDFLPTVLSTSNAGNPDTAATGDQFTFGSTSDFIDAVQSAVDGDGVLDLIVTAPGLEGDATRGLFRFNNGFASASNPTLTVTFIPEPASALLIGLGGVLILARQRD
ncbi:MAG: PEP-CTERM sorting domain-containing protein [Planctomycetota bacterium]